MGSWNKTCGLTNMAILEGEDVIVYPLLQHKGYHDRCYNTSFWNPYTLGAECKYTDYGEGGEHVDKHLEMFLDMINRDIIEMPLGENEYHDLAVVKAEANNPEWFYNIVHKGRLKIATYSGESQVDFMMVKKSAVMHFAREYVFEKYVGDGNGTCGWGNNYNHFKLAEVLAKIPDVIERLKDDKRSTGMLHTLSNLYRWEEKSIVRDFLTSDNHRQIGNYNISMTVRELAKTDEAACAKMIEAIIIGQFVDFMLMDLRKQWMPGCHEGSQDTDMRAYDVLSSAIANENDIRKKMWGEEEGEEE